MTRYTASQKHTQQHNIEGYTEISLKAKTCAYHMLYAQYIVSSKLIHNNSRPAHKFPTGEKKQIYNKIKWQICFPRTEKSPRHSPKISTEMYTYNRLMRRFNRYGGRQC